jgi:hypothetical protein
MGTYLSGWHTGKMEKSLSSVASLAPFGISPPFSPSQSASQSVFYRFCSLFIRRDNSIHDTPEAPLGAQTERRNLYRF